MSKFIYHIFVSAYALGIRIASLGNVKAKKWIAGRKNFPTKDKSFSGHTLWMHCASLGEFEQGRPLIEKIKLLYPATEVIITFFSPSGYEIMKNYKGADYIFYLPIDSPSNAKKFIENIKPTLVLWVKYEYWFYYLKELKDRSIPVLLISGVFRKSQPFFKWYGAIWEEMLKCFTYFFVQNENTKKLLQQHFVMDNISITGDTRFDRVIDIADKFEPLPIIEQFCKNHQILVAGSTWKEDEEELIHYIKTHPEIKFIIAPHEVDEKNLLDVKKEFPTAIFYSSLANGALPVNVHNHVLIIDNIGMLSRLYAYATICYVGGGFGDDGLHNILEAAVYGKPVLFGPNYDKHAEAVELIENGGAISIDCALQLEQEINLLLEDEKLWAEKSEASKKYVRSNAGATQQTIAYIQQKRLLIS